MKVGNGLANGESIAMSDTATGQIVDEFDLILTIRVGREADYGIIGIGIGGVKTVGPEKTRRIIVLQHRRNGFSTLVILSDLPHQHHRITGHRHSIRDRLDPVGRAFLRGESKGVAVSVLVKASRYLAGHGHCLSGTRSRIFHHHGSSCESDAHGIRPLVGILECRQKGLARSGGAESGRSRRHGRHLDLNFYGFERLAVEFNSFAEAPAGKVAPVKGELGFLSRHAGGRKDEI